MAIEESGERFSRNTAVVTASHHQGRVIPEVSSIPHAFSMVVLLPLSAKGFCCGVYGEVV
jgi:hypothetical protein